MYSWLSTAKAKITARGIARACRLNFYRLHLLYFLFLILLASGVLYASNGEFKVAYSDSLFLCASAMTNTGLNTINVNALTGWQQVLLCLLMLSGDLTSVSISVVIIRRYYFGKKIKDFLQHSKAGRRVAADLENGSRDNGAATHRNISSGHDTNQIEALGTHEQGSYRALRLRKVVRVDNDPPPHKHRSGRSHVSGYGNFPAPWEMSYLKNGFLSGYKKIIGPPKKITHHYLSFKPSLDAKGRFQGLTKEQEQELGGVEYRALKLLTYMLPAYTLFWIIFTILFLAPYSVRGEISAIIENSQEGNLNPLWWAVFISISSYTNTGLDLMNQSMIPFNDKYFILIITGMTVLAGNTFYPIFLRLTIWILSKIVRTHSRLHHSLAFLLHHPRRCYLFLFPMKTTWILLAVQTGITLLAWVMFELLNINQAGIDPGIPTGQRVIDGLYQAHGLRAVGFTITTMSSVAPALQFFYMINLYISAYPIIISLRQSNVYEERSVGQEDTSEDGSNGIANHIRRQLAYDLWWLLGAVFIICIVERDSLNMQAPWFTIFGILFEVTSGYGTVGLSLGVPYDTYSFCGAWHTLSKLVLISVMLRGRHRILPMAIDRAILLPGEKLMENLDQEYNTMSETDWQRQEYLLRKEESGEQAEKPTGNQDPKDGEGLNNKKENSGESKNDSASQRQ